MTTFSNVLGPFQVKPKIESKTVYFSVDRSFTGLGLSTAAVVPVAPGKEKDFPPGVRVRNLTSDSIPNYRLVGFNNQGDLLMPVPVGTTTLGFKARAPDGSVWYLTTTFE